MASLRLVEPTPVRLTLESGTEAMALYGAVKHQLEDHHTALTGEYVAALREIRELLKTLNMMDLPS